MTKQPDRTSAGRLPREQKAAQTDRIAKAYIEAERQSRQKRTDRLRALRLAREAAEADASVKSGKETRTSSRRTGTRS